MIADTIEKQFKTLEERGIPADSYFEVVFEDGSKISEKEVNWSAFSERADVEYYGGRKIVNVALLPIKRIDIFHQGLHVSIDVKEGRQVYQAIRSETTVMPNVYRTDKIMGRIVGVVNDGKVIEEQFLNSDTNEVTGFRARI